MFNLLSIYASWRFTMNYEPPMDCIGQPGPCNLYSKYSPLVVLLYDTSNVPLGSAGGTLLGVTADCF